MRTVCGLALLSALAFVGVGLSQTAPPNEREVKTTPAKASSTDLWTLDFRFKDPRIIKVNIPGRGTRIVWYMWYQVINRSEKPVRFQPIFELVTHEHPAVYQDEILPTAEEAIRKLEDPSAYLNIKNSYSIGLNFIPISKAPEEAFPRAVTGVAIWDASPADLKNREGSKKDLSDSSQFSIFVRGLSNGFVVVDPPAPGLPPLTREKTLQLKFRRTGDRYSTDSRDMVFLPPAEWTYRPSSRTLIRPENKDAPGADPKSEPKADPEK
ncbi:MAG: hypothetical protein WCL32_14125 [Planctomycetota bacterium]|jgi:hypothetical protein